MNAVLSWKHRKTERSTEGRGGCSIIQEQQRHQFPWFGGVNVLWVRDLGWSNESGCAIWKQFSIADHVIVPDESKSNLLVISYFLITPSRWHLVSRCQPKECFFLKRFLVSLVMAGSLRWHRKPAVLLTLINTANIPEHYQDTQKIISHAAKLC